MTFKPFDLLYSAKYGTCPGQSDPFLPLFKNIELIFHPHQMIPKKNSALVIWGGEDISPSIYGHSPISGSGPMTPSYRDHAECALIHKAVENNIPIIGICRGAQMLCAVAGGSLIQHVNGHSGVHNMLEINTGKIIKTNSYHHQMMNPFGTNHTLVARTVNPISSVYSVDPDHPLPSGLVVEPEIIYFTHLNGLAIQGHPEFQGPPGFEEYILNLTEKFLHIPSSL